MGAVHWAKTAERGTWRALHRGHVLTVSRTEGGWKALIEGDGVFRFSPPQPTRRHAQRYAERAAEGHIQ